jgi:hypothetical protein
MLKSNQMKASIGLSITVFATAVFYSHSVGAIFPALPTGMIVAVGVVLLAILSHHSVNRQTAFIGLLVFVFLSTLYKVTLFMFPASLIGYDTGFYAQQIQTITTTNRLGALDDSIISFYTKAPLFLLLTSIAGFINGTTTKMALVVYPIVVGVMYPIFAFVFTRRIAPTKPLRIATIASAIATVGTLSLQYGFHPISQTLAVMLWLPFLYILIRYYIYKIRVDFLLMMILLIALLYTHKAPGIVVIGTLLFLLGINILIRYLNHPRPVQEYKPILTLLLLSGIAISLQLAFLTDYLARFIYKGVALLSPKFFSTFFERILALFGSSGRSAGSQIPEAVISPLLALLINTQYALLLFPFAAVSWVALFVRKRSDPNVQVILASSAFVMLIVVTGYLRRSVVNPRRFTFFAEVLLIVLAAIGIGWVFVAVDNRLHVAKVSTALMLVIALLAVQSFAAPALPNHPVGSRDYLTTTELNGKKFTQSHVPNKVHTDRFYAVKPPANPAELGQSSKYVSMEEELLWRSENLTSHNYILFRENVDIYRTAGKSWRLTWNAQRWFSQKYSQVYSNGDVTMYVSSYNISNSS